MRVVVIVMRIADFTCGRLCLWSFIIMAVGAQVAAPFRVGVEGSAGDRHASHGAGADGQSVTIVGRQP